MRQTEGKAVYRPMKIKLFTFEKDIAFCVIFTLLITISAGCGKSSQNQPAKMQASPGTEQQPGKVPDQLSGIENDIEKIVMAMNGPAVNVKDESQEKGRGQGPGDTQQQGTREQQGTAGTEKSGMQEQTGMQKQPQQTQQPQQQDPWEKVSRTVSDLHYRWNSFMPIAAKMGANRALIDNFSGSLNNLTVTAMEKNKMSSLLAASALYQYVPDFYSLFKTGTSPEIKRIRYFTRNAILNSMTANWAQADSDINNLKASWALCKNTLSKDQHDNANKLDFSIYELEKVIRDKNQPLSEIKGRIMMSNIEGLEKSLEKGPGQGGGQTGGS